MAVLNNVTTADAYTAANTLDAIAPGPRVTLDVFNQSVFWQARISHDPIERSGTWLDEVFMAPSSRTISRKWITGFRVRSAVAGKPAQITAQVISLGET